MTRLVSAACLTSAVVAGAACSVNFDKQGFIDRVERRFPAESLVEVRLTTFDGSVQIRSWDQPEVLVEVEKRGRDKDAVSKIDITSDRTGDKIQVEARYSGQTGMFGMTTVSARFIVNVPRKTNLFVRTADGAITLERVDGHVELRSGDGSIKAIETAGDLLAETGDGSITLEDVTGRVEARTNDGSVHLSGTPSALRVRSDDGSLTFRIRRGAAMTEDWVVSTGDGSIVAELPDGFSADVEAEPGRDSRARSDLPLANQSGGTREVHTLRGRLGQGGHVFTLRTNSGSVRLTNY